MHILSIIIPAYNEEKTIHEILDKIRDAELLQGIYKEVVVVNDCSSDDTEKVILEYIKIYPGFGIKYVVHEKNKGKGAAIHTGIKEASGEFIIIQDADLEYDPEEYNLLLKPVLAGKADVVYGSRFIGGNPHRILFFWHTFGNRFLTFVSNAFSNLNLSDMETCYKLFKSEIIKQIPLFENRFGFEPEVTQKIASIDGLRIYEVGISYYGRTYAEGKKISWKDGFRALYCVLKYGMLAKQSKKADSTENVSINKRTGIILVTVLAALFFITGFHNASKHYLQAGYHFVFRSDGLGYYQYLPAYFLQNNVETGQPWCILLKDGRKLNKYSMGVAYMQAPFFFMANAWCSITNKPNNGYTDTHGIFIVFGAMLYAFLALLLIYRILLSRFGFWVAIIVPVLLFYATNLIYYTLCEPAMSHVYMFFLVALFVYRTPFFYKKPSIINTLWLAVPLAIIVLMRQYNIIIVLYLLLYGITSWKEFSAKIVFWISKWYYGIIFIVAILLAYIPQFIYWHMIIGKWYIYAYGYSPNGPEKFLYLTNPKIYKVLFGPISSLYPYAPILLLSLGGMVMMLKKRISDVWGIVLVFLIALYLISSWWCYNFDCGIGHRGFIDYYPLFAIAIAYSLSKLLAFRNAIFKVFLTAVFVFLMYLNVRLSMMYNWDPCWNGDNWSWKNYSNVIQKASVGGDYKQNYHVIE
jgi:glycosyltransferase involved in cell wall biosynthesis